MSLRETDLKYIWHPYTPVNNANELIPIVRGEGALLFDEDGKEYIDAVSSWWTNIHGHSHPYINRKLAEQAAKLEHVIFAGFTHEPAVTLAERLINKIGKGQHKLFFSDNGSTAVEVAIKMAFQYWHNQGKPRTKILAFENAYHGDTFGAMAVSGRSIFTAPFSPFLFDVEFIPIPDGSSRSAKALKEKIAECKNQIASFIFEPLVQGTAGMQIFDIKEFAEVAALAHDSDILLIADEVFTGFYRTGKFLAIDFMNIVPDIICLSKGITGGYMPLGVTTCNEKIFNAFKSSDKLKTFFHGHSYTGNPLACAIANASLDLLEEKQTLKNIERVSLSQEQFILSIRDHPKVSKARNIGTLAAFEFVSGEDGHDYLSTIRDQLYNYFIERGAILRPLGNTVYVLPPYCITDEQLGKVYGIIRNSLEEIG